MELLNLDREIKKIKKWMSNFKAKDLRIIVHSVDDYFVENYDKHKKSLKKIKTN